MGLPRWVDIQNLRRPQETFLSIHPPIHPPTHLSLQVKYQWVCQDGWTYKTSVDLKKLRVAGRDKDAPWVLQFDGVRKESSPTHPPTHP